MAEFVARYRGWIGGPPSTSGQELLRDIDDFICNVIKCLPGGADQARLSGSEWQGTLMYLTINNFLENMPARDSCRLWV